MKHQAYRSAAVMLGILLFAAAPAWASSIGFTDVASTVVNGAHKGARVDLTLRAVQSGRAPVVDGLATQNVSTTNTQTSDPAPASGTQTGGTGSATMTSTEAGATNVETIELGDVTGTVCDCGEILPAATNRSIPLLPFLAAGIAAVPIIITQCCDDTPPPSPPETPTPTPQPTPTPNTPIPEPATLLLFGSGLLALGAKARRRRAQGNTTPGVEEV